MRPVPRIPAERLILGASGAMLLASAGLAGRHAAEHMETLGAICGASLSTPHCGWCVAAAGFALSGAAAMAAALRLTPSARRAGAPRP
jgi:hypothetical protein